SGRPAARGDLLPVRTVSFRRGRCHRARRRRVVDRLRPSHLGRADRLHPLYRLVLLPDPAAFPGVRLMAADPGLGGADRRADAARDAHPARRRAPPTRSAAWRADAAGCEVLLPGRRGPTRWPRTPWAGRCAAASFGRRHGTQATRGATRYRPVDRGGRDGGPRRPDRRGQVNGDEAARPLLRPRPGQRAGRRPRAALSGPPPIPPSAGLRPAGVISVHGNHPRQHRLRQAAGPRLRRGYQSAINTLKVTRIDSAIERAPLAYTD